MLLARPGSIELRMGFGALASGLSLACCEGATIAIVARISAACGLPFVSKRRNVPVTSSNTACRDTEVHIFSTQLSLARLDTLGNNRGETKPEKYMPDAGLPAASPFLLRSLGSPQPQASDTRASLCEARGQQVKRHLSPDHARCGRVSPLQPEPKPSACGLLAKLRK